MKRTLTSRPPTRIALSLEALALLLCFILAGCGAPSLQEDYGYAPASAAPIPGVVTAQDLIPDAPNPAQPDTDITLEGAAPMGSFTTSGNASASKGATTPTTTSNTDTGVGTVAGSGVTLPQDDRKVVLYSTLTMESKTFDKTCDGLQQAAQSAGGYVSAATIGGSEYSYEGRYAYFTFKIPVKRLDTFTLGLDTHGTITQRSSSGEDITAQYVDVEARLTALKTQEARLLTLMEEAGSLDELLRVQKELTDVQYEIEQYQSAKRTYDSLVAYSTVDISVTEVKEYTPVPEPPTFGAQVLTALKETGAATVTFLQNMGLFLIRAFPTLVVLALLALLVRAIVKKAHKNRENNPRPKKTRLAPVAPSAYQAYSMGTPQPAKPLHASASTAQKAAGSKANASTGSPLATIGEVNTPDAGEKARRPDSEHTSTATKKEEASTPAPPPQSTASRRAKRGPQKPQK